MLKLNNYLSELKLTLTTPNEQMLTYDKGSLFHGVIMENIDLEYAELLHQNSVNPFSQFVRCENGINIWHIRTLTNIAREKIISPILKTDFSNITLKHDNLTLEIKNKDLQEITVNSLVENFYEEDCSRLVEINFLSPTAFKRNGRYFFMPDMELIYGSLMKRWDAVSNTAKMFDEDTFLQLVENTDIISYNIFSTNFHLENVRIPAFMGKITIKIRGTQTMTNFANMLFKFGNYSGVGIKTSIGMGAIYANQKQRRRKIGDRK